MVEHGNMLLPGLVSKLVHKPQQLQSTAVSFPRKSGWELVSWHEFTSSEKYSHCGNLINKFVVLYWHMKPFLIMTGTTVQRNHSAKELRSSCLALLQSSLLFGALDHWFVLLGPQSSSASLHWPSQLFAYTYVCGSARNWSRKYKMKGAVKAGIACPSTAMGYRPSSCPGACLTLESTCNSAWINSHHSPHYNLIHNLHV